MILRQDRALKFFHKKNTKKNIQSKIKITFFQNVEDWSQVTWQFFWNLQELHDIIMTWTRGRHNYCLILYA